MSGEGAALIILIVSCSMLPRMIGFCWLHTHLSQLGVFDLADTERERERRLRLHLFAYFSMNLPRGFFVWKEEALS